MESNTALPALPALLTEEEVATILLAKTQTIRAWRSRGRGPAYFKLAGKVRYRMDDVQSFIERSRVDPGTKKRKDRVRRSAMNLTEKSIEKLAITDHRQHFYDDKLTGFGIRIEAKHLGGRKSFFWRGKVKEKSRFCALGEFPGVTINAARTAARSWIGRAASWKQNGFAGPDPFAK